MSWTHWLIIQVLFACIVGPLIFFEKRHPSKFGLGTGCFNSNKYGTLICERSHQYALPDTVCVICSDN